MEQEQIRREELSHRDTEIFNQGGGISSGSRRKSSKFTEAGTDSWKGGISKELWKAFLI